MKISNISLSLPGPEKTRESIICFTGLLACILMIAATEAAQKEGEFFDSNGVQIHYIYIGSGEPVVLMHGFNANYHRNWIAPGITQKLLDAGYRVLALDARAYGQSGAPRNSAQYGFEMPLDMVRLLDHVGVEKARIVRYSMNSQPKANSDQGLLE